MCGACLSDRKLKTKTTFTVECNGGIIVIKNVPCLECETCGEETFTDQISEGLEKIVNETKKLMAEITVIDYNEADWAGI